MSVSITLVVMAWSLSPGRVQDYPRLGPSLGRGAMPIGRPRPAASDLVDGGLATEAVAGTVMRQAAARPSPAAPSPSLLEALTDREQEILRLLARGFRNPEIARRLHPAWGAVRNW